MELRNAHMARQRQLETLTALATDVMRSVVEASTAMTAEFRTDPAPMIDTLPTVADEPAEPPMPAPRPSLRAALLRNAIPVATGLAIGLAAIALTLYLFVGAGVG